MLHGPFDPHSRNLRKGRVSSPYACYSITKNVEGRRRVLDSPETSEIIFNSWEHLRANGEIKLLSFCIMPDHVHLLICLLDKKTLSEVVASMSKFTGREINTLLGGKGRFWQEGFHDHRCRSEFESEELSTYIEHNPVRAQFVEVAERWPYSSAFPTNVDMLDRFWYSLVK